MVGLSVARAALVLLLAGPALAGCATHADIPTTGIEAAARQVNVQATATTGVIRGIVVDSAIHPLAGARVTLRATSGTRETNTTTLGAFGFDNLPAGTYFLEAHKRGYATTRTGVDVAPGVPDPPVTKIALAADPSDQPYVEAFVFKGFLECGVTTPVTGVAVCFAVNSFSGTNTSRDHTQVNYNFAANLSWVQSEMVWTPTNPAGTDLNLWHSYTCPGQSLYCDHGPRGPSPLAVLDNKTWIHTLGLDAGAPLYMRVFSAELDGTHPPPPADNVCAPDPALGGQACIGGTGAALEQDFIIYTHAFHGFAPLDGWRFSKDGAPVIPPT